MLRVEPQKNLLYNIVGINVHTIALPFQTIVNHCVAMYEMRVISK